MTRVHAFLSDESGVTAIEYALIASLIAVFIIVAVQLVGTQGQNGVQRGRQHAQVSATKRALARVRAADGDAKACAKANMREDRSSSDAPPYASLRPPRRYRHQWSRSIKF